MTQLTDQIQASKPIDLHPGSKAYKLWHKENKIVTLVESGSRYKRWELSIVNEKIGTVEECPPWKIDEQFESNPEVLYGSDTYGWFETKAEAIGRLFTVWLVNTDIADPDIWLYQPKETDLPDYM